MQNYIKTFNSASLISVGVDVHKKTIAFCVYHAKTGAVLDERELPHDLPKVIKYLHKVQIVMVSFIAVMKRRLVDLDHSAR